MKKLTTFLYVGILFLGMVRGDVLLWMINPDAQISDATDGGPSVYTFVTQETIPYDGTDHILAARIVVKDAAGNVLKTLENISGTATGNSWDRAIDVSPVRNGNAVTAESQAHNALGQSNYYQMQILTGERHGEAYIYNQILYSSNYSGYWLEAYHDYNFGYDDDDSQLTPWTPPVFFVDDAKTPYIDYNSNPGALPEPSSGLLVIMGSAMLLLRRRSRIT